MEGGGGGLYKTALPYHYRSLSILACGKMEGCCVLYYHIRNQYRCTTTHAPFFPGLSRKRVSGSGQGWGAVRVGVGAGCSLLWLSWELSFAPERDGGLTRCLEARTARDLTCDRRLSVNDNNVARPP